MSQSPSTEDAISTDEQPRKYLRRNNDVSTGVTTRSQQREHDKKNKESETMSTEESKAEVLPSVSTVEQCAICMENLIKQEVGIPENCEHTFCLACIIEWAKKNNSCPIDRKVFRRIFKKHSISSTKSYDSMKVADNRLEIQLEDDFLEMINDDISCRVCGFDENEDVLLICDECGNGYHTYCLELPDVPDTVEWVCPLCEVDRISADEDLYPDSDPEEIQNILLDDTFNTTDETDNDITLAVRQPRVRQTARMRTGGVRNQRTVSPNRRTTRRRQVRRTRRHAPTRRRPTLMEQQRERQRRQLTAHNNVQRRIENVNALTTDTLVTNTSRHAIPRVSIFGGEPVAFEDDPSPSTTTTTATINESSINRSVITPREAARRIAASGIPILSRSQTEPSISRELSLRQNTPSLDRVPTRTIRPPTLPPRIPINQLPRIQRRADSTSRSRVIPISVSRTSTLVTETPTPTSSSSSTPSFLDNLLNSQERLHNLQNVRMNGAHIQIS